MSIFDRFRRRKAEPQTGLSRPMAGTVRQTQPNEWTIMSGVVPRKYQEYQKKDLTKLADWDHRTILKVLRSVSPEASQAITTYLRVFDSGHSIEVKAANGNRHQQGKDLLTRMINVWDRPDPARFSMPNNIRSLALKFALDIMFKGAIAGELVVDENLNVIGLEYVDPWSIEFEWKQEENRYVPYQYNYLKGQRAGKIILDAPNFFYIPVDPMGNDPYGEEQIGSAIQAIVFKFMVMQDLRMAIHTNGWRKMDFSVVEDSIAKHCPPKIKNDQQKYDEFVLGHLQAIKTAYASMAPDENLVHTDNIEVKAIEAQKGGMFDPKALMDVIDNQIANALKTFAVLLSKKFGGGSEGFTSSEMVLYTKLIGGFQRIVEELFERAYQLALKIQHGLLVTVEFDFKKPELRSDLELSQWRRVEIECIKAAYNYRTIGLKEMQERIRVLMEFSGPVPDDVREEMLEGNSNVNDVERDGTGEEERNRRRVETNRNRRSGRED